MRIGRKEALATLVASVIPWIGRRAFAQPITPVSPATLTVTQAAQIADLQKRVAALEAAAANQVAFVKDAAGNLTLNTPGNVSISTTNLQLKANATASLTSSGMVKVSGATISLN